MLKQFVYVFSLCLGLVVVAACGSSTNASVTSACSLLSLDTLSTVTGLTFTEGEAEDTDVDSGCVWTAEDRQGEVSVLVGQVNSADEFDSRVKDGVETFGSETQIDIAGATKSVEFDKYGLVLMTVDGQLLQVHQTLLQAERMPAHRELAAAVARSAS